MQKYLQYQEEAVNELLKKTYTIIRNEQPRQKLLLDAPTGSGKTVVIANYLKRLVEEIDIQDELPQYKFAFIWIAPNQLHEQSYQSLKNYFSESHTLQPITFSDVTDFALQQNQILFFNWQSISGENRTFINENEQGKNLFTYIDNTRNKGIEIIVILDEAHLFASKGKKALELLEQIKATMEIDVSATPYFHSSYHVKIERRNVVAAEMIKKTIYLNDSLQSELQDDKFNIYLLNEALKKREELKYAYENEGIKINPLLLIQLPSDKETETDIDTKIKNQVIAHLTHVKNTSFNNGKLAIWLSKEKQNLETITNFDNIVEVLIFKQGISLGWDCPRAAVLLIYREIKQFSFTVQTIGRIMRMPEQKHYVNDALNYGYVYTNLNRNLITIIRDEMVYMPQNVSKRKEIYENLCLESSYTYTREHRTDRLRASDFYKTFNEVLVNWYHLTLDNIGPNSYSEANKKNLTDNYLYNFDKSILNIEIIVNQQFKGDENELIKGDKEHTKRFIRYADEIEEQFQKFVHTLCPPYNVKDSSGMIEKALTWNFIEKYLQIFSNEARIVILKNQPQIIDLINQVFATYQSKIEKIKQANDRKFETLVWEVPPKLEFNESYINYPAEIPIMEPLFLRERENSHLADSDTEFEFIRFLESDLMNSSIKWWYKNGTKGKEHFAVIYQNNKGTKSLFYVDFVIQFKNGILGLFDTKTINSDTEMIGKHNALIDFSQSRNIENKPTIASIVLQKNKSWWYNNKIISIFDESLNDWTIFNSSIKIGENEK